MFSRVKSCATALQESPIHQIFFRNVSEISFTKRNFADITIQEVFDDLRTARPYEDIPGPKPLPILGNAWRFIPGFGEFSGPTNENLQESLHKKFGDILKITGIPGRADVVILYNPDDIEKVLRKEGAWPIRETMRSLNHYRMVTRGNMYQRVGGLLVSQGEQWQKFRTKVNPIMMQPRSANLYDAPIEDVANDFIERIRNLRDQKQEMPENFKNELHNWTLETTVYMALGIRLGCLKSHLKQDPESQKLIHAVEDVFKSIGELESGIPIWKLISTPTWRTFVKSHDCMVEIIMKYITEAMKRLNSFPEDAYREVTLLEKLLSRDPDPKTGIVMIVDMIAAGVDTTGCAVANLLHCLSKYPDKQQILFEEIKTFVPDKQQVTSKILNEMKYLKACIKESMRISPVFFGNFRELPKDLELAGYRVPKGTDILMPMRYISNLEKYFHQANKFFPERWLKDGAHFNKKINSFASLPFGFGPRMCIGRRFAELEIGILVTKVIQNFKVAYEYGDLEYEHKTFYNPISPLKFKMVDREI